MRPWQRREITHQPETNGDIPRLRPIFYEASQASSKRSLCAARRRPFLPPGQADSRAKNGVSRAVPFTTVKSDYVSLGLWSVEGSLLRQERGYVNTELAVPAMF